MKKKNREQILFSCLGTSDPVRGCHDGPMLHIVRQYRPAKIFWYMTKEMQRYDAKDDRFHRSIVSLREQLPDYEPELLEPYVDDRTDASEFDGFYETFYMLFRRLAQQYPDAEILVNITSGTPQMQITLALVAASLQFRTKVVQVKNFEHGSGKSIRTNSDKYDYEYEAALNEDNEPGAVNRCSEPELIVLQRERRRTQVESLLRRYDYEALLQMKDLLPERVVPLVQHLALRAAYDMKGAMETAAALPELELYPAENKTKPTYLEYRGLSEYLMILKLMQRTQRFTDLLIRLNPFVIRLQRAWLVRQGIRISDLSRSDRIKGEIITRERLQKQLPQLLQFLDQQYAPYGFRDSPLNIVLCNYMMAYLGQSEQEVGVLFDKLQKLNYLRNGSAHELTNAAEEDIADVLGFESAQLMKKLQKLLQELYPLHCSEKLFTVYEDANRQILEWL